MLLSRFNFLYKIIRGEQVMSNLYLMVTVNKYIHLPASYTRFDNFEKSRWKFLCLNGLRKCRILHHPFGTLNEKYEDSKKRHQQKLDDTAEYVFERCSRNDVMISSLGIERIKSHVQYLTEMPLHIKEVEELLIQIPQLLFSPNLQSMTGFLRQYGFSGKQVASVYGHFPDILDMDPSAIANILELLRKIGFYDANLLNLVAKYPSVILMNPSDIMKRVDELKVLFRTKSVVLIILKSPFVLKQNMKEVEDKFFYVYNDMGITQGQMIYADIFSHSLVHIKCRHQFLVKAGLFKKVAKKKGEISKNPMLQDILDTDDETFARKSGNMTEIDYITFRKMFEAELQEDDEDVDVDSLIKDV